MNEKKLVIFSICKDEEKTIGELIRRIPEKIHAVDKIETLVISDGSSDSTVKEAKKAGVTRVIEGHSQKRLAYRFQQAVDEALEMGADYAVNIDGDLQFKPEDIPELLEPVASGEYDFAAADRFVDPETNEIRRPENMPVNKYYANRIGAYIVGMLSGYDFADVTCGFRAYNRKALIALNINSKYTYTQESFQLLAAKRFNITSVPVEVKYYKGRKSRVVTSFAKFLFGSAFNIVRAFRDFAPLRFFGSLSLISLLLGFAAGIFILIHWLQTGAFSPYKFVGFISIYFISVGIVIMLFALLADMFARFLNNQEKILENVKDIKWNKKEDKEA